MFVSIPQAGFINYWTHRRAQLGINQRIIPLFVDYAIKIHLIFDFRDQVANSGIG